MLNAIRDRWALAKAHAALEAGDAKGASAAAGAFLERRTPSSDKTLVVEAAALHAEALEVLGECEDAKRWYQFVVGVSDVPNRLMPVWRRSAVDLVQLHFYLGEYDDGLKRVSEVLASYDPEVDQSDPSFLELRRWKAVLEMHLGFEAEARAGLEHLLSDLEQSAGEDTRTRAHVVSDLAVLHLRQGDLEKAASLAREALELSSKSDALSRTAIQMTMVEIHRRSGQGQEAFDLVEEVLEVRTSELGANDAETVAAASLALTIRLDNPQARMSEQDLHWLASERSRFEPGHPMQRVLALNEATVQYLLGNYTEARKSIGLLESQTASEDPRIESDVRLNAHFLLAALLVRTGELAQASQLLRTMAEDLRTAQSRQSEDLESIAAIARRLATDSDVSVENDSLKAFLDHPRHLVN